MTTFSFSTGNPTNLTGGATASMTDLSGSFADLKTFLNGGSITDTNVSAAGLTDTSLASPTNAVWRTVLQVSAKTSGSPVITTTPCSFGANGDSVASGASGGAPQGLWIPPASADVAVANKTTRLRLRTMYTINGTAPGITITWGLYPVTAIGGAANLLTLTLGTVVAGSTVSVVTPGTNTGNVLTGTSFDFSTVAASTFHVIGIVGNGSASANSLVGTNAWLEMRHT